MSNNDLSTRRNARIARRRVRRAWVLGALNILLVGTIVGVVALAIAAPPHTSATVIANAKTTPAATAPPTVDALPVPQLRTVAVPTAPAQTMICDDTAVAEALAAGDDSAVIAAAGGAEAFRSAVAEGDAECISLSDTARVWTVVNKQRPLEPIDYAPQTLATPANMEVRDGRVLRDDAAAALSAMAAAAAGDGAGVVALESGYRSYSIQQTVYDSIVGNLGHDDADHLSARPGHSEHQLGLTADVVACDGGCTTLDGFAGTAQADWVAEHAWEYGFITRYLADETAITGYWPEPWHLRYIGPELAAAYHDGGWRTLEEFFGLPAAPDYIN